MRAYPDTDLRKADVGVTGPINGMGEDDLRGSYFKLAIVAEDDEFVRFKLSRGQLEALRDECVGLLSK